MPSTLDHALVAARILRPKRSDPWPVLKLVRGITDPSEAWTALGKILPPTLAANPSRGFQRPYVLPAQGEPPSAPTPGVDVSSTPLTMAACLAIATDPSGILGAEDDAREVMKRLAPWGETPRAKTLWTFVPTWPAAHQGGHHVFNSVQMSLQQAYEGTKKTEIAMRAAYRQGAEPVAIAIAENGASVLEQKLCEPFVDVCGFAIQWQRACELELVVPRYEHAPGRFVPCAGEKFADLPDPFEPMVALMKRGYWLSGATDDALVLCGTELARKP